MSDYGVSGSDSEETLITMNVLKEHFRNSKTLHIVIKSKSNDFLSFRKKVTKAYYLSMLANRSIFAKKKVQKLNKLLEAARSRERKELYAKMWKVNSSELWDMFRWRRATFSDICWSGFDSGCSGETEESKTNELFWNDVAGRLSQTFLKYDATSLSETSISLLVLIDAIMTNAIDPLANNIDAMQTIQAYHTATNIDLSDVPKRPADGTLSEGELFLKKVW